MGPKFVLAVAMAGFAMAIPNPRMTLVNRVQSRMMATAPKTPENKVQKTYANTEGVCYVKCRNFLTLQALGMSQKDRLKEEILKLNCENVNLGGFCEKYRSTIAVVQQPGPQIIARDDNDNFGSGDDIFLSPTGDIGDFSEDGAGEVQDRDVNVDPLVDVDMEEDATESSASKFMYALMMIFSCWLIV